MKKYVVDLSEEEQLRRANRQGHDQRSRAASGALVSTAKRVRKHCVEEGLGSAFSERPGIGGGFTSRVGREGEW